MNGGRGAKGSVNDRLISIMYRNRYKKLQLQKEAYSKGNKKSEKKFLKAIEGFDIEYGALSLDEKERSTIEELLGPLNDGIEVSNSSIGTVKTIHGIDSIKTGPSNQSSSELHDISEKMIEYDPLTEKYDFDKFDYYELIEKRTGIGALATSDIIDIDKEIEKVEDEIAIVDELEKFIDEGLKLIDEVKSDLKSINQLVTEQYTEKQIIELEYHFNKVKEKVDKLKKQYDVIKDKYNFEDFEILASIQMMVAITDYKDKTTVFEMETLVDFCKNEIEQIDGIIIEEKKSVGVGEDIGEKKAEIKRRDREFDENKKGVIHLNDLEHKIVREAREQRETIAILEKKLANFSTEIVPITQTIFHTERLFGSFLKVAAGILTTPFSGRSIFGTMLGTHLINKGIRGIRESLTPEQTIKNETIHRYENIEREILNSKDYVNTTDRLITDSIYQIDRFDEEFKNKFSAYTGLIPEYKLVEKQIQDLKRNLIKKKLEVDVMKKDLDRQYDANKVKVRKAS
jgi:hypothetical protein